MAGNLDADFSPSHEVRKLPSGGSVGQSSPAAKQSWRWWWGWENQTRAKKPLSGAVDEKYLSSKGGNGKDIRERTDCSIP